MVQKSRYGTWPSATLNPPSTALPVGRPQKAPGTRQARLAAKTKSAHRRSCFWTCPCMRTSLATVSHRPETKTRAAEPGKASTEVSTESAWRADALRMGDPGTATSAPWFSLRDHPRIFRMEDGAIGNVSDDRPEPGASDSNPWQSADDSTDRALWKQRDQRISVVVPAMNEEEGIGVVLQACLPYCDELLVVDGHSTDRTRTIAEGLDVRVIHDNGNGKGDAIRVAIEAVTGDIIVFVDADQSHRPSDIPRLVAPILRDDCDHVVGSRSKGGSDELHGDIAKFARMIGSDIITLGINYRFNVRLTDSQNGFRAIRTSVARTLGLQENITTIEQEMTIKTLAMGYRMGEVPIHEYPRSFGESKIQLWRVSVRYVYSWLKYLLFAKGPKRDSRA
jgi:hypothetical protein